MGANIGLLAGVAVNVYLWLFVPEVFWFWWNAVGAVVTLTVGLVTSLLMGRTVATEVGTIEQSWNFDWTKTIILLLFFAFIVIISVMVPSIF